MKNELRVVADGGLLRIQFEPAEPPAPTLAAPLALTNAGSFKHTPDYGTVVYGGKTYSFSLKQKLIVAALANARRQGFEWLDTPTLLEVAESDGGRVRDIFRGHPAWEVLIVPAVATSGRPGTYRLAAEF